MTQEDIQLIGEFTAKIDSWYEGLKDKGQCASCGVIPDRMLQLGQTLKAFITAWEQKHGKQS